MKKLCGLLCCFVSLFGQMNPGEYNGLTTNQVRRTIQMEIVTSPAGVAVALFAPAQEAATTATITADALANIQIPTVATTTTWAKFQTSKTLNLPFTITYNPNAAVMGGYQGFFAIGPTSMNLNYLSSFYFDYQAIPLFATSPSSLLFFALTEGAQPLNNWFQGGSGVTFSTTWTTDTVVQVSNSFGIKKGTSVTFNVAFPYTNLVALPYGQYWFSGYALMQPYTTPPVSVALINTILTNAEQQILVRNSWITSINNLTNMSALGKTITTANKALLVSQINAIITQTNAYLAILTKTPNASMSVLQAITTAQAALTAYTIPVPK